MTHEEEYEHRSVQEPLIVALKLCNGVERCGGVVQAESVRQPRKGEERARAVKPSGRRTDNGAV